MEGQDDKREVDPNWRVDDGQVSGCRLGNGGGGGGEPHGGLKTLFGV